MTGEEKLCKDGVAQDEESPEPGVRQQDYGHYDLEQDNTLRRHFTEASRVYYRCTRFHHGYRRMHCLGTWFLGHRLLSDSPLGSPNKLPEITRRMDTVAGSFLEPLGRDSLSCGILTEDLDWISLIGTGAGLNTLHIGARWDRRWILGCQTDGPATAFRQTINSTDGTPFPGDLLVNSLDGLLLSSPGLIMAKQRTTDPRDRSGPGEKMKGTLATVSARNLLSARYLARSLLAFEPMARSNLIWTPNWLTDNRTGRAAPACGIDRCDPLNHLTNSARGTNFLAWQSQAFKWIDHTVCAASNPSFPSGGFPYRLSKAPSNSNSLT
ncbi:hypothetical protein K449DRAFT_435647 [Hypoxylon sp. EC38]|nr:hypothetical protein K449DRAFT_435647 [Hypoxylon sp. EC38]